VHHRTDEQITVEPATSTARVRLLIRVSIPGQGGAARGW
jgi:hypothetical protein